MKKIISIIALLTLIVSNNLTAQDSNSSSSSTTSTVTSTSSSSVSVSGRRSYIGASVGYLLNDKKTNTNPMWYLKDGTFYELNLGTRNNLFGWDLSIGNLSIKRDVSKIENLKLNSQLIYDKTIMGLGTKPIITNPFNNGQQFQFGKANHITLEHKDYNAWYLLTGPSVWVGGNKLQVNIKAEGGIAYTNTGYYFVDGEITQQDIISSNVLPGGAGTLTNTKIFDGSYSQYGMSQKYYDDLTTSTGPNFPTQKREFTFIARASANLEYFITPNISIHGGANYWFLGTPKMNGQQASNANIQYTVVSGLVTANNFGKYNYTDVYTSPKMLNYLSANVGVKFWMGGKRTSSKSKTTTTTTNKNENAIVKAKPVEVPVVKETPVIKETPVVKEIAKDLAITVKDKCTGVILPNVLVSLKNDGAKVNSAYTDVNGVANFTNVSPQSLEIIGVKNEVASNTATIQKTDFGTSNNNISLTLLHDDPRFTLIGTAVTKNNGQPIDNVTAAISNLTSTASRTAVTNDKGQFYEQLEQNSDFKIVGQAKGNFSAIKSVSTKNLERCKDLYVRLEMPMEEVSVGKKIVLNDIFYDVNKDNIRPDAARELNNVVDFMKANPTVKIELGSHTDSRSSDSYNLELSQRRAQSAVNYIASKGIEKSRLVARGYGETQLKNECSNGVACSEAKHQENRRTEIKILEQ